MTYYYTYLIGWPDIDRWYYGVRTGNTTQPENDFWIYYFTSSKIVAELRKEHGEPPVQQIRKRFTDKTKAKIWERNVLRKMSVVRNQRWINQSVPGAWELTDEICAKISKSISNKRWITDGVSNCYINNDDIVPDGWWRGRSGVGGTPQWKQKLSEAQSKVKASAETKAKLSAIRQGEDNSFWGKTHSKESISKMSASHKKTWSNKAKKFYVTPWGKFISTPDAAKAAPFDINHGMVHYWCLKYGNKEITSRTKIGVYFPEYVGKTYKDVGFRIEPF